MTILAGQLVIDGYHPTMRYEISMIVEAEIPGVYTLALVNTSNQC